MRSFKYVLFCFFTACLFLNAAAQAPQQAIVYEQKALDFFADSILNRMTPFKNLVAHFNGWVDSIITTIEYSITQKFPGDTALLAEYEKREQATRDFWIQNNKPPFLLQVKKPLRHRLKRHYGRHSKAIRLMVFQQKQVGAKHYVWLRTFVKDGYAGYDLYFVMDQKGAMLYWTYQSFIF